MNNENENKKEDSKKKGSLIISAIVALFGVIYFHVRMGTGPDGMMTLMSPNGGQWTWGYTVLLVAVFFIMFSIMFFLFRNAARIKVETSEEDKKRKKSARVEFVFLLIDALMTAGFVRLNWEQISSQGTLWGIAEVAAFFAIVWAVFELFNHFSLFPQRILDFIVKFFVYVCIPSMILIIVLLGAFQAKYGYVDVFSHTNIVFTLYNIGQSNPGLWSWLPIAAFLIFTILLLIDTFTKKEKNDDEKDAQVLIDESLREQLEEEDYELGRKKRPLAYNFFHKINEAMKGKKEREKEAKEKEEDKHIHGNVYDIKFIKYSK